MAKIDDPLGQAEEQHRHRPSQGLARLLNLAAPVMSLLDPESGALATMMGFLTTAMGQEQSESQAEVFRAAFIGEIRSLEGRVEVIERVTAGPDAQDAFAQAMRAALGTARQDKARVFGRLLGVTVKQESPNWQEAAEFIRTIEEFGDLDISALKIFWRVQSTAIASRRRLEQRCLLTPTISRLNGAVFSIARPRLGFRKTNGHRVVRVSVASASRPWSVRIEPTKATMRCAID